MNAREFRVGLKSLINTYSMENGSNTSDYVLAQYLLDCLAAFDKAVNERTRWYHKPQAEAQAGNG